MLPVFFAHRFGREYGADSSESALAHSLAAGITGFETDCCLTIDEQIVLLHDPYLPDSIGRSGWAYESKASEIVRHELLTRNGQLSNDFPKLLDELLADERLNNRTLQLDIKAYASQSLAETTTTRVLDIVDQSKTNAQVEIVSFWPSACMLAAHRGVPSRLIIACAYLPQEVASWMHDIGISGVILEGAFFSNDVLMPLRDLGISVMSGVVNDFEQAKLVAAFEPDAIASDRPIELARQFNLINEASDVV